MNIWHIGDTHTYHGLLTIPDGIDMIIHSGDAATARDSIPNTAEFLSFIDWFKNLPVKHKIFVAGNHDVVTQRLRYWTKDIKDMGIHYLENDEVTIDGIKFWGSPYTPTFGRDWAWQMNRNKIGRVWDMIPDDTGVVITHGPPKGILDYTLDRHNKLESVGDSSLAKRIDEIKPAAHLFGHVHNTKWIRNSGMFVRPMTIYSNASVVEDGKFGKLISNGNILTL